MVGNPVNALALIKHAHDESRAALPVLSGATQPPAGQPRNIDVTAAEADYLQAYLAGELQRHQALVHIFNLQAEAEKAQSVDAQSVPLVERLHQYPVGGVDLTRIVEIPPRMAPIPVKPIFLDIAWNYIDYPGKGRAAGTKPQAQEIKAAAAAAAAAAPTEDTPKPKPAEQPQPQKKGWFGFGR